MVKFKVPLKDILGRAYYQYELSSSNYNPTIDSTITITCTCKNILGNPIPNKELTLMMNGIEQGTETTNELGIATWNITFNDWGNKHFYIENATLDLIVTGWKTINTYQNGKITLKSDGKWGKVTVSGTFTGYNSSGSHTLQTLNRNYDTENAISELGNYGGSGTDITNTRVIVSHNGELILNKVSTTGSIGLYCTIIYPLKDPKY